MFKVSVEQAIRHIFSDPERAERTKQRLLSLHHTENGCIEDTERKNTGSGHYGYLIVSLQTVDWDDMGPTERNRMAVRLKYNAWNEEELERLLKGEKSSDGLKYIELPKRVEDNEEIRRMTRRVALVPMQRLIAMFDGKSAPRGRPGCGNKWCLNPDHFTTNPNKWAIAKMDVDTPLADRLMEDRETLLNKEGVLEMMDDPEYAKGRRINVKMRMSDGSITRGKIAATRLIEYLRSLDVSQHAD